LLKNIAGTLKLELAQFREVESFSAFGSELDETTQFTLDRGLRLIELLKQDQFFILPVKTQIVLIFAGMRGYLDGFAIRDVLGFKRFLIQKLVADSNLAINVHTSISDNESVLSAWMSKVLNNYSSSKA